MTTTDIYEALLAATRGHPLDVKAHPDLRGASVTGRKTQAYVYPRPRGGYSVDLWRGKSSDAQVILLENLHSAIRVAVDSALGVTSKAP